jgi:hypothetical protein
LWPFLPFLYLPPVASLGNRVYRRVADHRLCHVNDGPQAVGEEPRRPVRRGWTLAPTLVGALILAAMIAVIPTEDTNAWPVALYPTFAGLHQPRSQKLVVVVRHGTSDPRTVALKSCFPWMPTDRYQGLVRQTVQRASRGHVVLVRELVRAIARERGWQLAAQADRTYARRPEWTGVTLLISSSPTRASSLAEFLRRSTGVGTEPGTR